MALHSRAAVIGARGSGLLHKMVENPVLFLFILLLFLGCGVGVIACVKRWEYIGWRSGFIGFSGLLVGLTYYFSIRDADRSYNMIAFSPSLSFCWWCSTNEWQVFFR